MHDSGFAQVVRSSKLSVMETTVSVIHDLDQHINIHQLHSYHSH